MPPRNPKAPSKAPAKLAAESKDATPRKAVGKPVKAEPALAVAAEVLRLKDLVETVATATGANKPEAKKVVEATLAALAAALTAGATIVVPPLGKLRVVKATGVAMTLKLRPAGPAKPGALALAEPDQDS